MIRRWAMEKPWVGSGVGAARRFFRAFLKVQSFMAWRRSFTAGYGGDREKALRKCSAPKEKRKPSRPRAPHPGDTDA